MKKKEVSTINNSVYYESDEHVDTISDSSKPVDSSNEPITDTQIVEGINNLSVGIKNKASPKALLTGARKLAATSSRTS